MLEWHLGVVFVRAPCRSHIDDNWVVLVEVVRVCLLEHATLQQRAGRVEEPSVPAVGYHDWLRHEQRRRHPRRQHGHAVHWLGPAKGVEWVELRLLPVELLQACSPATSPDGDPVHGFGLQPADRELKAGHRLRVPALGEVDPLRVLLAELAHQAARTRVGKEVLRVEQRPLPAHVPALSRGGVRAHLLFFSRVLGEDAAGAFGHPDSLGVELLLAEGTLAGLERAPRGVLVGGQAHNELDGVQEVLVLWWQHAETPCHAHDCGLAPGEADAHVGCELGQWWHEAARLRRWRPG
mmetsp:Transcript_105731/g.298831  ORF Transcript_105731/g.298831 Transcript_105731/m.298831 type:complete len:294 (+) Transcript_105731:466-1347(+)